MEARSRPSGLLHVRLALEFAAIFIGGPLAILAIHRGGILFLILWLGALVAWAGTRGRAKLPKPAAMHEIRGILIRFAVLAPLITLVTWAAFPHLFLSLPRQRPLFWALIMVLYPLLSVWPQEMLYRSLLFHRYRALFRSDIALILVSAVAFGFAHIIFLNWIAIAMTAAGGLLFARDYARHRSLPLTCLEHSLYGCLIFTVGLGRFFYTGAAWHH
ncbi:CPBP family intramembrane metalloprotease [Acidisoma cellulosilytica]|uniref:CPBP family intramembrane metalloprotease n=1 Tax=Acidisoma cellulosilyticum TaxID=2802395 RepID=A0A964E1V2_9PROT|nr:CPBP family intramembrane glutamic endopeptidase [Acidisoma cellulosilyticum]MCB8878624.1 CPBP family intramembrane metalloprotease [Acidisoma cellulosilyticum]